MPVATQNSELKVIINHADNQMVVFMNGKKVKEIQAPPGDPSLSEDVDVGGMLLPGRNTLLLLGINFSKRARFQARVTLDGNDIGEWDRVFSSDGTPGGLIWEAALDIQVP